MVPKSVQDHLEAGGVAYRAREVPPGLSDADLAVLLGVSPHRLARTAVLVAGTERLLVVVPAGATIDPAAVERVSGLSPVRAATAQELATSCLDCEPGFAPPFGKLFELPVVVDVTLAQPGPIHLRGGSAGDVLELDFVDYADLEDPLVAPVTNEGEALAGPGFIQGALGDAV